MFVKVKERETQDSQASRVCSKTTTIGIMAAAILVLSFPTCHNPHCGRRNEAISLRLLSSSCCLSLRSHAPSAAKAVLELSCSSSRPPNRSVQRRSESISLCTKADDVDPEELSILLAATRQNCDQFPPVLNDGSIAPVDPVKLRRALRHSTVVVALYVQGPETSGAESNGRLPIGKLDGRPPGRGWLDSWILQSRGPKVLVAFGRATSDHALTASIYDLAVKSPPALIPILSSVSRAGYLMDGLDDYAAATCITSTWGRHFSSIVSPERKWPGRTILSKIRVWESSITQNCQVSLLPPSRKHHTRASVALLGDYDHWIPFDEILILLWNFYRELRQRGISDIAATSPPELRPFFEHCGFGPDTLKSVTMMYTRSASGTTQSLQIKENGRKSLLIPPPLKAITFAEVVARC